jgi:hypothetical protein
LQKDPLLPDPLFPAVWLWLEGAPARPKKVPTKKDKLQWKTCQATILPAIELQLRVHPNQASG